MFHKVLKHFNYCLDGIHAVEMVPGQAKQVQPKHVNGLAKAGYIELEGTEMLDGVSELAVEAAVPTLQLPPAIDPDEAVRKAREAAAAADVVVLVDSDSTEQTPTGFTKLDELTNHPDYLTGFGIGTEGEARLTVEQRENEQLMAGYRAGLSEFRARIDLSGWEDLTWPQKRKIATALSDEPIANGEDAEAAMKAELARRESLKSE